MVDKSTQALKGLTVALWALTAVLAVHVATYLAVYVRSMATARTFMTNFQAAPTQNQAPPAVSGMSSLEQVEDFYSLPLERKIALASVIAIGRYKRDGDRIKCVLSEILKVAPGTTFYYAVGDEFQELSHMLKPNESYGDGQLVFFVGSPATFSFSTSFNGDRISGFGDMPLELLRKKIAGAAK
jgi:hypothetical protein